ncbi:hypothetical protein CR513_33231, partial [Mucuna pruriens]
MFIPYLKCDILMKNMSTTFNSVIISARGKPIVMMLEEIKIQMNTFLYVFERTYEIVYAPLLYLVNMGKKMVQQCLITTNQENAKRTKEQGTWNQEN